MFNFFIKHENNNLSSNNQTTNEKVLYPDNKEHVWGGIGDAEARGSTHGGHISVLDVHDDHLFHIILIYIKVEIL